MESGRLLQNSVASRRNNECQAMIVKRSFLLICTHRRTYLRWLLNAKPHVVAASLKS